MFGSFAGSVGGADATTASRGVGVGKICAEERSWTSCDGGFVPFFLPKNFLKIFMLVNTSCKSQGPPGITWRERHDRMSDPSLPFFVNGPNLIFLVPTRYLSHSLGMSKGRKKVDTAASPSPTGPMRRRSAFARSRANASAQGSCLSAIHGTSQASPL